MFAKETDRKAVLIRTGLESIAAEHEGVIADLRGVGLIQGMSTTVPELASQITAEAFSRGIIIETAGPEDEVVKLLPPLVVSDEQIDRCLDVLAESTQAVVDKIGDDLLAAAEATS